MNEVASAFNLLGPVCSSWGLPNRGTSRRDFINWRGADHLPYIAEANVMISRCLGCILALRALAHDLVDSDRGW